MLLPDHPALTQVVVTGILRDLPDRAVLAVDYRGQPAFLKLFRQPDYHRKVLLTQDNLRASAARLGQGGNAVALPLLALPDIGALLFERAPGDALSLHLAAAAPARRAALIARAGAWLAALTPQRSRSGFAPRYWLDALIRRRQDAAPGAWLDAALIDGHLARLRAMVPQLRGAPVERAPIHGDFTPDNLFLDDSQPPSGRLSAIDMQGESVMPVARDIARMLVWLESRRTHSPDADPTGPKSAGPTTDGIATADYQALTTVPGLLPADQRPILRFMIGDLMAAYYLDAPRQPARRAALARAMTEWARG